MMCCSHRRSRDDGREYGNRIGMSERLNHMLANLLFQILDLADQMRDLGARNVLGLLLRLINLVANFAFRRVRHR